MLSRFLAYLGQFKSKSHIQGHPQKVENKSFYLTPSLMGVKVLLLEICVLEKGREVCRRTLYVVTVCSMSVCRLDATNFIYSTMAIVGYFILSKFYSLSF